MGIGEVGEETLYFKARLKMKWYPWFEPTQHLISQPLVNCRFLLLCKFRFIIKWNADDTPFHTYFQPKSWRHKNLTPRANFSLSVIDVLDNDRQKLKSGHSLDIHWTFSGHSLNILWTFSGHSLDIVRTFYPYHWSCICCSHLLMTT